MRALKFGGVGVLNTAVDYVVFNVLALWIGFPVAPSTVLSYTAGIANSWFWNRRWTFSDQSVRNPRLALPSFIAINLVGLAINTGIVLGLQNAGDGMGMPDRLPQFVYLNAYKAVAVLITLSWNYMAAKRLVFE